MTTRNGPHRPGDPVAAARPGVEAPVRQVVATERSPRDRAGLVAVAVVTISVVAAGLGLIGGDREPSGSGSAPPPAGGGAESLLSNTPSPAATVRSTPSTTPTASGGVAHLPTSLPGQPLVSPAVPCGSLASDAPAPGLYLAAGDAEPVLGVDAATSASDLANSDAIVTATFPVRPEVRVAGDACATSWTIEIRDPRGALVSRTAQGNLGESPSSVAQNRIEIMSAPLGRSTVRAWVLFGRERVAQAAWVLELNGPPVPDVEVIGPTGDRTAALPGTCVTWTIAGRSAYSYCEQLSIPLNLERLVVNTVDAVRLVVPGWEITSWNVSCGTRTSQTGFEPVAGCSLGGYGDGSGPAGPALFLPFPGRTTVVVWLTASQGDAVVIAPYYVDVEAQP